MGYCSAVYFRFPIDLYDRLLLQKFMTPPRKGDTNWTFRNEAFFVRSSFFGRKPAVYAGTGKYQYRRQ